MWGINKQCSGWELLGNWYTIVQCAKWFPGEAIGNMVYEHLVNLGLSMIVTVLCGIGFLFCM